MRAIRISSAAAGAVLARAVLLAVLWWVLTEGEGAWGFGLPVVLAALVASLTLAPPGHVRVSVRALAPFAWFFLWRSLRGGMDVAWRALHPDLPIAPAWLDHVLRLPPGPARVLFANVVTLMPGTLVVEERDDLLRVHVLDQRLPVAAELDAWQERVAALLGVAPAARSPHG